MRAADDQNRFTDVADTEQMQGFDKNQKVARRGGNVAGVVEKTLKVKTRQLVMTSQNIDKFRQLVKVIMTDAAWLPEQIEENVNGK